MKKIKVSVALLAIIVAVGSSFTTAKFANDWFQISGNVTSAQYQSDNGTSDFDDITTYVNTTPLSDAAATTACPVGLTYVCAASIPEYTQNSSSTVLEQADLDDLQANRLPSTIAVKFKN